jgi:lysophosphatidate acyltransferase
VIFVVVTLLSSLIGIVISCCCYVLDKRHLTNYYTGMVYYQLASAALNIRCEIILPEAKFQFPDQCVVIANHQSSLDLFIMAYFWPQKLAVIAKESMKYYPILGWHLALAQNIFIRRQQRDKALQAMAFAAKKIVENKVSLHS